MYYYIQQITTVTPNVAHLPKLLCSLGMTPILAPNQPRSDSLNVILDGRVVGVVLANEAKGIADKMRTLKATGKEQVNYTLNNS